MKTGIYKITSPSGKIYIGQSIDIEVRFKTYNKVNCKTQRRLYNSFIKYGVEKHFFEIIELCKSNDLNRKERYYQDLYNVIDRNKGLNCLLQETNEKEREFSKETKIRLSKSKTGKNNSFYGKKHSIESINKIKTAKSNLSLNARLNISNAQKGKKASETTKLKMSKARKGVPQSEIHILKKALSKSKVILNIKTGVFYKGVKEASVALNINISTLYGYLNGGNPNKTDLQYV